MGKTAVRNGFVQSEVQLNGKTVIVTGANTGIGFETALDLTLRGARVIMACRNIEKAENARQKILDQAIEGEVIVKKLDLASLKSVRQFCNDILETESRLDILINNAGLGGCPAMKTEEGYEMHLGVNHIGHFLLTSLLLDLLKKSSPSRIVIVSAKLYVFGHMNWNDIMKERNYHPIKAYIDSKLANVLHCLELSRRLEGTGVTCNVLHPGVIKSEFGRYLEEGSHLPFLTKAGLILCYPFMLLAFISVKKGAQTTIYCAIAPELKNVSGKYFENCIEKALRSPRTNKSDAEKLWEMSEEWTKEK